MTNLRRFREHDDSFGNYGIFDSRGCLKLQEPADLRRFFRGKKNRCIRKNGLEEFHQLDRRKMKCAARLSGGETRSLRHRLGENHAGNKRTIGKMSGKKRLAGSKELLAFRGCPRLQCD